jgi:hypothetical protein
VGLIPFRRPEQPEPRQAILQVLEELPEEALPRGFRDFAYAAGENAKEALLRTSGLDSRLGDLEELVRSPSLGVDRVAALEQEFDRLADLISRSVNIRFQRNVPGMERQE